MIKLAIIIHLAASLANPGAAVREATLAAREISTAAGIELQISEAITEDLPPLDLWQGGPVSPTALYLIQEIATLPPEKRIHLHLIPPDVTFYGEEVPAGAPVMSGILTGRPGALAIVLRRHPQPRRITRYAIEHELLHVLGATHQPGRNVMTKGNFAYISPRFPKLKILRKTAAEVRRTLKVFIKEEL